MPWIIKTNLLVVTGLGVPVQIKGEIAGDAEGLPAIGQSDGDDAHPCATAAAPPWASLYFRREGWSAPSS